MCTADKMWRPEAKFKSKSSQRDCCHGYKQTDQEHDTKRHRTNRPDVTFRKFRWNKKQLVWLAFSNVGPADGWRADDFRFLFLYLPRSDYDSPTFISRSESLRLTSYSLTHRPQPRFFLCTIRRTIVVVTTAWRRLKAERYKYISKVLFYIYLCLSDKTVPFIIIIYLISYHMLALLIVALLRSPYHCPAFKSEVFPTKQ